MRKEWLPLLHKRNSGKIAKERLKNILTCERSECSEEMLEMIRGDLIVTLSKYVEIDKENVSIQFSRNITDPVCGVRCSYLNANIPIRTGKA